MLKTWLVTLLRGSSLGVGDRYGRDIAWGTSRLDLSFSWGVGPWDTVAYGALSSAAMSSAQQRRVAVLDTVLVSVVKVSQIAWCW